MCRISGIISKQPADLATLVASMRDCMQHGGPDDAGIYVDQANGVAFGHRRLSIIDLSEAGHQPMSDDDGNLQISFNGEIFNFQELKEELLLLGHRFRTQTDTEVILKAYLQWGNKAWSRLNGMYALSLYDKRRNIVILVRDHAGIKPLYYSHKGSSIYFSSEVKAFKTIDPHWPEDPNWKIFFLAFGHLPEPVTTLNAVHPLKKGHFMEINLHNLTFTIQPFNEFRFTSQVIEEQEAIQMIRQELDAAVKRHLIADAPIGLFLSGGIDSSILTLIAKKYKPDNLYTLSINFDQSEFSEKYYQDIIIKKTGAHHQSFRVTQKDFEEKALDIFKAMDQPSADGINTYFISKYAHEYGLKAVLSGLGADELLGGYPSFRYSRRVGMIRRMPAFITGGISRNFLNDRFRKMDYLTLRNDVGEYLFYRGIFITRDIARILGTTEEDVSRIINKVPHHDYTVTLSSGNRASELELNYYMQNQLLKDSDYMSMWHGLEIRVPFLDKYFMQLVYSIEPGLKFNHRQGKHLLIKAFEDILPREVWDRKKQGFTFPFSKWFPQSDLFRQYQDPSHQHYYNLFNTNHLSWGRIWTIFIADYYGQQIH